MPKDAVFTMKIEPELRDAFMAEAAASHRPASQIVREAMRDFIDKQKKQREYDAWFLAEMEEGVREADDPNTVWITQEEMEANTERLRQSLLARLKAAE
jgi:predicted transcriptional regulator